MLIGLLLTNDNLCNINVTLLPAMSNNEVNRSNVLIFLDNSQVIVLIIFCMLLIMIAE